MTAHPRTCDCQLFLVRSLSRLQDLQSLAFPPLRHSRGMTVTTACRHACHLAVVWLINTLPVSWYVYFLTADTFLIWNLRHFYLSAVTALCGAVGLQVSLLGLGIFRKKQHLLKVVIFEQKSLDLCPIPSTHQPSMRKLAFILARTQALSCFHLLSPAFTCARLAFTMLSACIYTQPLSNRIAQWPPFL